MNYARRLNFPRDFRIQVSHAVFMIEYKVKLLFAGVVQGVICCIL